MLLIWPTLYWARPSSKVATRNEEEKKSLVPVPCRQDGNGGCYSCRNQHWGSCQVLSDAPKGDLRGLHPSTFNQTQQQHSALALAAFPGAVLCCTLTPGPAGSCRNPAPAEDEEQLFADVRQLLGATRCHSLQWGERIRGSSLCPGIWGKQWLLNLMLWLEIKGGFASEATKGKPLEICILCISKGNLSWEQVTWV